MKNPRIKIKPLQPVGLYDSEKALSHLSLPALKAMMKKYEKYGKAKRVAIENQFSRDKYFMAMAELRKRKNPGAHFKDDDFRVETWFERDRAHVALVNDKTDETVIEWWDDEVQEAVEDGFLDPKNWKRSALNYAKSLNLIWGESRPMKKKNPSGRLHQSGIAKRAVSYGGKLHFIGAKILIFIFSDIDKGEDFVDEIRTHHGVDVHFEMQSGLLLVVVTSKDDSKKNPIKDDLMAEALAALAGLLRHPERSEDVREEVLDALEAEGYWNVDRGVTEKGRKFLEDICSLEDLPE